MSSEIDINKKFFSLSAIVDTFLNVDVELSVAHYFQKYLTAAKWYLVTLKTAHAQDAKTVLLDISDVLTVTLPPDFVNWVLIAEPYGQYLRTLGVNNKLAKTERVFENMDWVYSGPPGQLPNGVDVTAYGGYELANYSGGHLFSLGGGLPSKGFFRIVEREGTKEILLDVGSVCGSQLYLEYICAGFNPCGTTVLNPFEAEAVRKFLNHHFEKTRKDGGKTEAAIFRTGQELYHAEAIVRASKNDLDPDTMLAVTRSYYRLTNKI